MATLDEVLQFQRVYSILKSPAITTAPPAAEAHGAWTAPATVNFALRNNTPSPNVFAYVTGLDLSNELRVVMLQSDGRSMYHPTNPSTDGERLGIDCAISLGGPGETRTITVPRMAGGRVWFVQDARLTFFLNRGLGDGPALVEPSVVNPTDRNRELRWSFCEFTLNGTELFANISYVDFVSHPIALKLETAGGGTQRVEGITADGLERVAEQLKQQSQRDGAGWNQLVRSAASGELLRVVSPNLGQAIVDGLFSGYFEPYIDEVWRKYSSEDLVVDTQAEWGVRLGRVTGGRLVFSDGALSFPRPNTRDIFSSDSGAFAPPPEAGQAELYRNVAARLAAAFNRATLLINPRQPEGEVTATYYQNAICNHYSRIMHGVSIDGRGYAFPYDDVAPTNGIDQAGTVASGSPTLFTIMLGGSGNTSTSSF